MKETGAGTESLDVNMKVGFDDVSVVKKNPQQKTTLTQGVPVLVDPVITAPTGAETDSLDVNMKVGYDEVSVAKKKKAQQLASASDNGVPIYVNPTLMPPTGAETEALPVNMTVGGSNFNSMAQQLSQESKAKEMMKKVEAYCQCKNHAMS
jgi:hypothetical protein